MDERMIFWTSSYRPCQVLFSWRTLNAASSTLNYWWRWYSRYECMSVYLSFYRTAYVVCTVLERTWNQNSISFASFSDGVVFVVEFKEREKVASEWLEVSLDVPESHTAIKRWQLNKLMGIDNSPNLGDSRNFEWCSGVWTEVLLSRLLYVEEDGRTTGETHFSHLDTFKSVMPERTQERVKFWVLHRQGWISKLGLNHPIDWRSRTQYWFSSSDG